MIKHSNVKAAFLKTSLYSCSYLSALCGVRGTLVCFSSKLPMGAELSQSGL